MPKVRAGASSRFVSRASQATDTYESGVRNPRTPWAAATLAAEKNQAEGSQKAIAEKRFSKGVSKAGDAAYLKGAVEKGTARFAQGVQAAEGAYAQGVAPYTSVIESTSLPARYPKGDPRNLDRVKAITTALHAKKAQG